MLTGLSCRLLSLVQLSWCPKFHGNASVAAKFHGGSFAQLPLIGIRIVTLNEVSLACQELTFVPRPTVNLANLLQGNPGQWSW
jgi:hypothetical protein